MHRNKAGKDSFCGSENAYPANSIGSDEEGQNSISDSDLSSLANGRGKGSNQMGQAIGSESAFTAGYQDPEAILQE